MPMSWEEGKKEERSLTPKPKSACARPRRLARPVPSASASEELAVLGQELGAQEGPGWAGLGREWTRAEQVQPAGRTPSIRHRLATETLPEVHPGGARRCQKRGEGPSWGLAKCRVWGRPPASGWDRKRHSPREVLVREVRLMAQRTRQRPFGKTLDTLQGADAQTGRHMPQPYWFLGSDEGRGQPQAGGALDGTQAWRGQGGREVGSKSQRRSSVLRMFWPGGGGEELPLGAPGPVRPVSRPFLQIWDIAPWGPFFPFV